jgi:hypothetical protein
VTEGQRGEEVPLSQDPSAAQEARVFETHEDQEKRLRNQALAQDITERRKYAGYSFALTCVWVGFIIFSTIAQFTLKAVGKGLDQAEFITLITTTTGSVLGFWLLVGRYLFRSPSMSQEPPTPKKPP